QNRGASDPGENTFSAGAELTGHVFTNSRGSSGQNSDGRHKTAFAESDPSGEPRDFGVKGARELPSDKRSAATAPLTAFIGSTRRRMDEAKLGRLEEDLSKASQENEALNESLRKAKRERSDLEQSQARLLVEIEELKGRLHGATSSTDV
ncbi:MAG: hypothetical protein AAGD07_19620, partial [Planctomycetota bacterium]